MRKGLVMELGREKSVLEMMQKCELVEFDKSF